MQRFLASLAKAYLGCHHPRCSHDVWGIVADYLVYEPSASWSSPIEMARRLLGLASLFSNSLQAAIHSRWRTSIGADVTAPLVFTPGGTFQITIFEDLHFGESKLWGTLD